MILPSSTTSRAGSVTLAPTSPVSVSTVSTSSTAAFSCLPPQRTIAYTENSLSTSGGTARDRASSGYACRGPTLHHPQQRGHREGACLRCTRHHGHDRPGSVLCADHTGYQTDTAPRPAAARPGIGVRASTGWTPVRRAHPGPVPARPAPGGPSPAGL